MKKLYITAGHEVVNGKGTGANGLIDEAVKARELTTDLAKALYRNYGINPITDRDNWKLSEVINWLGGIVQFNDISVDIHFNAGPVNATGAEVFIPNKYTIQEYNLATDVVNCISDTLKIRNRGVKTESMSQHKKLGILSGRSHLATNILIEVCFVTNQWDVGQYILCYWELVEGLAKVLARYIKEGK